MRHTLIPSRLRPVEEYLKPQRRFRHLFLPERNDFLLKQLQDNMNAYWEAVRLAEHDREPVTLG